MNIWIFMDGKPGHENQSLGLAEALARRRGATLYRIPLHSRPGDALDWLLRRQPATTDLPDPDLILGAGHASHFALLAARRARGGRIVVSMRPSLPLGWFDLCVIPVHDRVSPRPGVLLTQGALNRVQPRSAQKESGRGLILLGGPSAHVAWNDAAMLEQIGQVLARSGNTAWTVASSRRTPGPFWTHMAEQFCEQATLVDWRDVDRDWLPGQLARAELAWVSEDSVSMVYEALTAGCGVGLLAVPARANNRLRRGLLALHRQGLVLNLKDWLEGAPQRPPSEQFDEAGRVADWVLSRWFEPKAA